MNRTRWISFAAVMLCLALALCVQAFAVNTVVSDQKLRINGSEVSARAYNIDGNNYFKLRDMAYLLNGSTSQFSVNYDASKNRVSLTTGSRYVAVGGELATLTPNPEKVVESPQTITLNGTPVSMMKAYNINGNNFFKLRDLGSALGFEVGYDDASRTMLISTPPSAEYTITVNGKDYWLDMSKSDLIAKAGQPKDTLTGSEGWTWYVFGTNNYAKEFFLAGVVNDTVVSLMSEGSSFTYKHQTANDTGTKVLSNPDDGIMLFYDSNYAYHLHMVSLTKHGSYIDDVHTQAALDGESKLSFYLTNAFRARFGLSPLTWDDKAAKAARNHSADMAANNYFSHTSKDGKSYDDRLKAYSLVFKKAQENFGYLQNISTGYAMTFMQEWINAEGERSNIHTVIHYTMVEGHRSTLLSTDYTAMGVGAAAKDGRVYFTQDFYG